MICAKCHRKLNVDELAYQILRGYVGKDNNFEVEEGSGFVCQKCYEKSIN